MKFTMNLPQMRRNMNPIATMTEIQQPSSPREAIDAVRAQLQVVATEIIPLAQCNGRVLAQAIHADRDSPALNVSAMDGFAVRMADLIVMAGENGLPMAALEKVSDAIVGGDAVIVGGSAAIVGSGIANVSDGSADMSEAMIGHAQIQMRTGNAVRIVTGAPIPIGADVVVRYEDVVVNNVGVRLMIEASAIKTGANIRRRGENAKCGDEIARTGVVIGAATIGAMASFGVAQVVVRKRVRVALVTTGDELVGAHDQAQPWQVRDSNGPVLESLLGARPWIEIVSRTHARDDADTLADTLTRAMDIADAVILTGGVSMGHKDFVPQVAARLGARTIFHKLPQRPGRPMFAATRPAIGAIAPRLILGLPGNPVSVMVTARRLGLEMLGALAGISAPHFAAHTRGVANADNATLPMWWYRLVGESMNADGINELHLLSGKGSGDIAAAASSVGFVEVAPGQHTVGAHNFYAWKH
jgi:molybdopterin molybdotransferase